MPKEPWPEVEKLLHANGCRYPWKPRDTARIIRERDALATDNAKLRKQLARLSATLRTIGANVPRMVERAFSEE